MKILAVDTATQTCSVAVLDNHLLISEYTVNHGDTHSKFLMPMIRDIMDITKISMMDLDGFAVTIGPGSFTGLRIGLSTVKGLAMAVNKPLVGVSTLETLAHQAAMTDDMLLCPMMDARRKEVYTASYRFKEGQLQCVRSAVAVSPETAVTGINEPCMMVGDGVVAYQTVICERIGELAIFADSTRHIIRASAVGFLAMQRFIDDDTDDAGLVQPVYLRKSDAEKNLKV